ncbi:ribonuclease P protein component [Corynebacterium liangguodongii]|uniref:Ribonuclease P protein component n=1 Tax=Corynebacterium liangguodongii TaxID=2079535 RepID=A0A2S0WGR7_9CORY|nr:ribonuclease P protein component [Corynebacterium liangguodongii]AWB84963.1 ribonuclease P protein component [Corynebacterium liangguodongii]PWB99329.1 ribonuclease P protein component [Corynebacterium liangguodongii]
MLPKAHKLSSSADFRRTTSARTRAGSRTLVVHVTTRTDLALTGGPRFGFVVSKAVGNAVTRHRVSRQLRHIALEAVHGGVDKLARPHDVVVRALPAAARAPSAQLREDFAAALAAALAKAEKRAGA